MGRRKSQSESIKFFLWQNILLERREVSRPLMSQFPDWLPIDNYYQDISRYTSQFFSPRLLTRKPLPVTRSRVAQSRCNVRLEQNGISPLSSVNLNKNCLYSTFCKRFCYFFQSYSQFVYAKVRLFAKINWIGLFWIIPSQLQLKMTSDTSLSWLLIEILKTMQRSHSGTSSEHITSILININDLFILDNKHTWFVFALLMFRPNVTEHGWWSVRITDCRYCDPMQIRVRSRSANQRTVLGRIDQSEPRKCSPGDISDERHILSILVPSSLGVLVADEVSSGRFSRISPGVRTS